MTLVKNYLFCKKYINMHDHSIMTAEYYLELGQMVSISKYRDTLRYRYQTFKVSSVNWIVQ